MITLTLIFLLGLLVVYFGTTKTYIRLMANLYIIGVILSGWLKPIFCLIKSFLGWACIPLICYIEKRRHAIKTAKNAKLERLARKQYFGRYF